MGAVLERLSRTFTVYAPVMPGYGAATGLEHLADLADLTLYNLEVLNELGVTRAHVVGHFLGGMIAAEMAAASPLSVNRLVLVSPAGVWRDEEPVADLLALNASELSERLTASADGTASLDGLTEELSRDRMQDIAAAGKFLWPLPDKGLSRRAYRIKASTLILWGAQDRINPPSYSRRLPENDKTFADQNDSRRRPPGNAGAPRSLRRRCNGVSQPMNPRFLGQLAVPAIENGRICQKMAEIFQK